MEAVVQALMRGKCFFSCRFVVAGGRDAGAKFIVDVIDENTEKEFNDPNSFVSSDATLLHSIQICIQQHFL